MFRVGYIRGSNKIKYPIMKKKLLLLTTLLILTSPIFAQSGGFVELINGTIIKGKVEYQSKLFRSPRIIVNDSTSYPVNRVRAYKNSEGYFLKMSGHGGNFARRIEEGNIDLYTRTINSYSPSYIPGPNGTSMFVGGGMSSSQVEYFTKNDGPVLKVNARNLKRHLSDNELSMSYLKKRDGLTAVQIIGAIAGASIMALSITSQADSEELDPTGAIVGLVVISGSTWLPYFGKKELTQKAIKAYNNPERYN